MIHLILTAIPTTSTKSAVMADALSRSRATLDADHRGRVAYMARSARPQRGDRVEPDRRLAVAREIDQLADHDAAPRIADRERAEQRGADRHVARVPARGGPQPR